jgi:CRP-like cAMP-binding protein
VDANSIASEVSAVRALARPSRSRSVAPLPSSPADPATIVRSAWIAVLEPPPLAPEIVNQLQALSSLRDVPAGTALLSRSQSARELSILARGDAALGLAHDDAPFHPERAVQAPDWLDASSAWLGATHAQDAMALSDVQVVSVPRAALQTAMGRHPELARRLVTILARQVFALTEVTHDLMHKDAESRFAAWLLHRCTTEPDTPGRAVVALHERKRDIAAQLAITPETLSRLLRQLSRKGLIEVLGYTVRVLDLASLKMLAVG